jgi:transaldolase
MPEATLNAVADHGTIRGNTIAGTYDESRKVLDGLAGLGIDYDDVIQLLELEGVQKFEDSYAQLVESVKAQVGAAGRQ